MTHFLYYPYAIVVITDPLIIAIRCHKISKHFATFLLFANQVFYFRGANITAPMFKHISLIVKFCILLLMEEDNINEEYLK